MNTQTGLRRILLLAAGLAGALLVGCNTTAPTVSTHPDSAVAYGDYKTFALMRSPAPPVIGDSTITPDIVRQVRQSTATAFAAKGLARAPEGEADLLVLVHGGVQDKLDVTDRGFTYGRFGRGYGGYDLDQYKKGTLLIDVFDAKTRELVWRGAADSEVHDKLDPVRVKSAVDAVVSRYPN